MSAKFLVHTLVCLVVVSGVAANAQRPSTAVISIDHFRTNLIDGEMRHEILPIALFDGQEFVPVWEWSRSLGAETRRPHLLSENRAVQVMHRGRRIGIVSIDDIYLQQFHCSELIVGTGEFDRDVSELPASDIIDSVWAIWDGERIEYETQAFVALSGDVEPMLPYGDPLVSEVADSAELERFAIDVEMLAPRGDLIPLGEDETRAFRLNGYDATVVVRKRRSGETLAFPAGDVDLPSPLLTDIVVVRTGSAERQVQPLWISTTGTDAWGKGPNDRFIDAFELEDGTAYLVFARRNYEAHIVLIYRVTLSGESELVFEDNLYGC